MRARDGLFGPISPLQPRPDIDTAVVSTYSVAWLWLECLLLVVGVPYAYIVGWWRPHPLLLAAGAAIFATVLLRRDPTFDRGQLWNARDLRRRVLSVLRLFFPAAVVIGVLVAWFSPDSLFNLVRHRPGIWAVIMVGYPVLSVFPQELVYRSFFFHRYERLFGDGWSMIAASAIAFAYMHILFNSWLAVAMTLAGGVLFAWRYWQTRSLLVTSLEHALYGQLVFTIGLGAHFFHGTASASR
jgi:membrane protease YdiL (CAAX protease family)